MTNKVQKEFLTNLEDIPFKKIILNGLLSTPAEMLSNGWQCMRIINLISNKVRYYFRNPAENNGLLIIGEFPVPDNSSEVPEVLQARAVYERNQRYKATIHSDNVHKSDEEYINYLLQQILVIQERSKKPRLKKRMTVSERAEILEFLNRAAA